MRFAIDIGGTKTAFGVFRDDLEPQHHAITPTPTDSWDQLLSQIETHVSEAAERFGAPSRVGVSVAGVVQPDGWVRAANVPAIHQRALAGELAPRLRTEVVVANDASCFALAEHQFGAGKGSGVTFGAILGTGVGGGMVVDGRIVDGPGGAAGEWGHGNRLEAQVEALGLTVRQCPCGAGTCLDLYGAGRGLHHIHADLGGAQETADQILARYHRGDETAAEAVAAWLTLVAPRLAHLARFLGGARIIMGGGLANDAALMTRLESRVRSLLPPSTEEPCLVVGTFPNDGSLRGAACL